MVKEYRRAAAGKIIMADELRPAQILSQTTDYLISEICSKKSTPWKTIYEFVFDRLRAVRQDLTVQNINNDYAINILEKTVRFLLYSGFVLRSASMADYDEKINNTHIQECLKRLLYLYASEKQEQFSQEHSGEILSYYLLFNLGDPEALTYALEVKHLLQNSFVFKSSLNISLNFYLNNYGVIIRNIPKLLPLELCAIYRHLHVIQRQMFERCVHGYTSKNLHYPTDQLKDLLLFDTKQELSNLCKGCGQQCSDKGVTFNKASYVYTKIHVCGFQWVEAKVQKHSAEDLIFGCISCFT